MVQVIHPNKVMHFTSVASIQRGLRASGQRRLAAIEAAGRFIYPEDHPEERAEIVETIEAIGHATNELNVRKAVGTALWALDMHACVRVQAGMPRV